MMTKSKTKDAVIIWLFGKFLFHLLSFVCWRIKFLLSILIFFYQWWQIIKQNSSIIYEKIAMWMGDDKKIINYEWPYTKLLYKVYKRLEGIVPISPALSLFFKVIFYAWVMFVLWKLHQYLIEKHIQIHTHTHTHMHARTHIYTWK